ncbi:MAG: hypothetical protein Q8P51_16285, partial [Ignavibacteria bacterium]|nr:hypothetical protein [Ignavibacteria bacterium]
AFSSGQQKYLIQLRDTYAQLEHLPTDIQDDDLRAILVVGLNAYIFLFQSIFSGTEHDVFTSRVIRTLIRNTDFKAMRMEGLRSRLEHSRRPHVHFRQCLMCEQDAIVLEANNAICLLCGFTMTYDKLSVFHGGLMGPCPKCDDGFLGSVPFDNDRVDAVCPLCGYVAGFCCLPHPHQGERHRVESYPRGRVNLESVHE